MTPVTQRPVKVLLVEHDPDGLGGLRGPLEDAPGVRVDVEHVNELGDGLRALSHDGVDVVLLDLCLPDSRGVRTFERARAYAPEVPIVVLAGEDDHEAGIQMVRGGAQDYLVRDEVDPPAIARSIRYALERHRLLSALRSLALLDELTGLYNQRGFSQLGGQYLELARRTGRGGALVFLDIDRFRAINETLGRHVGDRALIGVADVFRSTVRSSDLRARLAADEFAILALESTAETVDLMVGRIRSAIDEINGRARDAYELTVSIGVAAFGPADRPALDALLEEAAEAMQTSRRQEAERPL